MGDVWQCPVWHPGDCEGTPMCPPRCPRYVASDGTSVTITEESDRLLAVDSTGDVLAEGSNAPGRFRVERAENTAEEVAIEVARQAIARAHERRETHLEIEAEPSVIEALYPVVEPAVTSHESGRLTLDPSDRAVSPLTLAPARGAPVASAERLDPLIDPDAVAVFGATDREGSIGRVLLEQLQAFEGAVLPVSDRRDELLGFETVEDLHGHDVDLALIALPADAVIEAVEIAIEGDVPAVAILSAGFGEADNPAREQAIAERLATAGVAAIGPNALGVVSTRADLNASFAPRMPPAGGVSIVSHSGAMITAMLEWAASTGVGVRDVVSLGNRIDVTAAELIRYWGRDPDTEVIAAYLEDLPDGRAFVEAARDVTPTTPIVALKAGHTAAGAAAASSHTGAVAGDDAGFSAAFDAAGVLRARGQDELLELTGALARLSPPTGRSVAVVTNAGGPGVVAADAIGDADLELASLGSETTERLSVALPDAAAASNPIDVLGDADVDRVIEALSAVLADPGVEAVMVTTTPHPLVSPSALVEAVDTLASNHGTPVVVVLPGDATMARKATAETEAIVATTDAGRGARLLASLERYGRSRRRPRAGIDPIGAESDRVADQLAAGDHHTLGVEAFELLDAYGVSTAETRVVTSPDTVQSAVAAVGGEAVLKVVTPDLAHKTDVGGVVTDVTESDADSAYRQLRSAVETNAPDVDLEGVAVQAPIEGGVELLVGVTTHERFGPVVTVGIGGVFVEHLADVVHGLAPISVQTARDLVLSLDAADLITAGPRGEPAPDFDALADAIARLSRLGADHEGIRTLEVNPLIATPSDAIAVDLHIELDR